MIGNRTRIKVVKNKIAPPFKEAEFDIMFGKGISKESDILDLAVNLGIIQKSGAWLLIMRRRSDRDEENESFLKENPQAAAEIEQRAAAHYGLAEDTVLTEQAQKDESKDAGESQE